MNHNFKTLKIRNLIKKFNFLTGLMCLFSFSIVANPCGEVDFKYEINNNIVTFYGESKANVKEWIWQFGDGTSQRGQEVKHIFNQSGTYEVCLVAIINNLLNTGNVECTSKMCKKITLGGGTNADCGLKVDFEYKLDGEILILNAKSNQNTVKFIWSITGRNEQYTGQETKIKMPDAGVYEICLTATNGIENCKTTICKKIEVESNCAFELDFRFIENGNIFTFQAKTTATTPEYFWDFGDGKTGSSPQIRNQYNTSGNYTVCLTIKDRATDCSKRICKTIRIHDDCGLYGDFKFTIRNNSINFIARSNSLNSNFYWDFGNGQRGEGSNVNNDYKEAGVYNVCLTIPNEEMDCKIQICKRVIINRTIINPDLSNVGNLTFSLYPNPTIDFLHIKSESEMTFVKIFDTHHDIVYSGKIEGFNSSIDVSQYKSGMYYVQVFFSNGNTLIQRFIKK